MTYPLNQEVMQVLTQEVKENFPNVEKINEAFLIGKKAVSVSLKTNNEDVEEAKKAVLFALKTVSLAAVEPEEIDPFKTVVQQPTVEKDGTLTARAVASLKEAPTTDSTLYGMTGQPVSEDAFAVLEIVQSNVITREVIDEVLQRCKEHERYAAIHTGSNIDFRITIQRSGVMAETGTLSKQEIQQVEQLDKLMNQGETFLTEWRAYTQLPLTDGYRVVFWTRSDDHNEYPLLNKAPNTP